MRLVNRGPGAFAFTTCPVYQQEIRVDGGRRYDRSLVTSRYVLNCHGQSDLAAGASRTYDMVTALPAGYHPTAKLHLGWTMEDGPDAGVEILP